MLKNVKEVLYANASSSLGSKRRKLALHLMFSPKGLIKID